MAPLLRSSNSFSVLVFPYTYDVVLTTFILFTSLNNKHDKFLTYAIFGAMFDIAIFYIKFDIKYSVC